MVENQNEKIVYDIEVRVKSAQEELNTLKREFNNIAQQLGQKLKFEADFKITGMEDFRTLQQRLVEVRRALQYVSEYKNKLAQISVGNRQLDGTSEILATEKTLRALEKTLEDMQKQVNAGNFNKQIQEQQKLQNELEKTIKTYQRMEAAFNRSFTNKTAWSTDKFATQFEKFEDVVNRANNLSKQLGFNQTFENPMRAIFNYDDYKKQTQQWQNEENKRRQKDLEAERKHQEALANIRAKQNRQANDTHWANLEKERAKNTKAHQQAMEAIYKAEQQYMNIYDQLNTKKKLGVQLSELEYANAQKQLKNAKERYRHAGGDVNQLPRLGTRKTFNDEAQNNYIKNLNSRMVEALQMSTSYHQQMNKLSQVLDTATYAWNKSGRTVQEYRNIMLQAKTAIDQTSKSLIQLKQATGNAETVMDKMMRGLRTHLTWIASSVVASLPLVLPGYAIGTMKNLESRFATVEQVMPEIEHAHKASLDENLSEMERMTALKKVNDEMNVFIDIGRKFGVAVDDVIEAGASIGRMYGQGENGITNTNLLTQQAARIAVADNFPMIQATKGLESALSQFGLQTENTNQLLINSNRIIDVWTMAAHNGAASAQDLTQGVQLAGAAAHQAGISFEFLNALIATGVRATGRSGNEIGNSIKSFVNSMQSDKSIKALQDFGINVFQDNGDGTQSLRSMEDVILDISRMMQTTNKDYSGLLLTLSGGKYQVSKLTAILKDYKELVRMTGLLNSDTVTGFTDQQIEIQLNTLTRKLESLYSNIQGLFMNIGNNGGLDFLKSVTDYINNIVTGIRELDASWGDWIKNIVIAVAALKGVPYLINNVIKMIGGVYQRAQNTWNAGEGMSAKATLSDRAKNIWSTTVVNPWNKGRISNGAVIESKKQETQAIDDNTRAEKENEQAKSSNAQTSSTVVATTQGETSAKNKAKTATDSHSKSMQQAEKIAKSMSLSGQVVVNTTNNIGRASQSAAVGVGVLSTAMRGANAVMAAFGGPVGLAITALSILIPTIISYAENVGELKNKVEETKNEFEEWSHTQEETYNRQVRAAQSAKTLAENYNQLKDELNKCAKGSEEYKKIEGDLQVTKKAAIDLIGEENVAVDENGKIKLGTINEVAGKATEAHEQDLKQKQASIEAQEKQVTAQIESTKEILKTFDKQNKGIGILKRGWESLGWSISAMAHRAKAGLYQLAAAQLKATQIQFGGGGDNTMANQLQQLANEELQAADYDSNFGLIGSREEIQTLISSLEGQQIELQKEKEDIAMMLAESKEKNPTGGADSNRGNLIAEPPEEKAKGKSKAEKEAEKLARQQENLDKYYTRIGLIGEQSALNYSLRRTSFSSDTGLFSSGNTNIDNAIAQAAQKYSLDEKWLHALVQKESSYNTRAGEGTNYKGLMQISADKLNAGQDIWDIKDNIDAGARYFKQMLEMANGNYRDAYVKYNAGPYAGYSSEAEVNADKFQELYNKIVSGTSDFGTTTSLDLNSNISEASKWADEMAAQGKYYGENGCTAFVKAFLEQAGNSFAEDMSLWTPDLLEQAKQKGLFKNQSNGFNAGDVVIVDTDGDKNEPDHVVIADGKGGYWGNSNSNQSVVHGNLSDFNYVYGGIATGSANSYQASLSSTSLASSAGFVYNLLKDYGVEMEKLNMLADATNIPSMIAATDRAGMNVTYGQKVPIAGDILYGDDGKAYVVRSNGGYISSSGETGKSWKDISNLTDTYTSFQYATGVDLENAGSKLGGLKLSEAVENLVNMRVDREYNAFQKIQEDINKGNQKYGFKKSLIENRRSLSGQYDFQSAIDEYDNEVQNYLNQKLNFEFLGQYEKKYKEKLNEMFSTGALKEIISKSGYSDWSELSSEQINKILQEYSKVTGDDYPQNTYNGWKQVSDAVDNANISMKQALTTVKQLNGEKSPEEQLNWELNRIDLNKKYWTSNYANTHNGSYDGLEWQTNKQNNQNAIRQVQLYRAEIERLEKMQSEAIKNGETKKYVDELTNHILEMRIKLNEAEKSVDDTGDRLTRKSKETISGMLHDLIKGGSSFKDIWKNIWDEVAKIALDRILGIKDTSNSMWDLVSNIFGFSGKSKTVGEGVASETGRFLDNQNIASGSKTYSPMSTAERVGYSLSAGGVADFYAGGTGQNQAAQLYQQSADTNLQAAQIGQEASAVNQAVSTVSQAVSATDQASSTIDQTAAATMSAASSSMLIASADMLAAANIMASASFGGGFGKLPFAKGGPLVGFAKGGRMLANGGKVKGAGTGTSDSILGYLQDQDRFIGISNGEYVMNAKATRKYEGILKMMNMDKFASGGSLSTAPVPYVPTLKNPSIANKIAQKDANNKNQNATMEKLLGQQNGILQGIANSNSENNSNGQVVVLNTRASKEEVFSALASDPRALQKLLGNNRSRGFR